MRKRWAMNGALMAALCSLGVAQETAPSGTMPLDTIIQSVQQAQAAPRPQASYQIIREYRLFGAKDSKADSEVVAEINFRPPASRDYTIQRSSGSSRGPQLVRRILDHEVEVTSKENKSSSAISSDNYSFSYLGEAALDGQPCYVLGLKPKRTGNDLISGQVWVDKHSFLVRQIQGEVEKPPSWWLKTVRIKIVFADLDGIWVQKSMEAIADVRIVGAHTLTSRILDYRREHEVATTSFAGGALLRKR
ncbi:MAG: outer membrane lipoprotein-sorting protein [Candidatus Sulfotelmatobacter sp.]